MLISGASVRVLLCTALACGVLIVVGACGQTNSTAVPTAPVPRPAPAAAGPAADATPAPVQLPAAQPVAVHLLTWNIQYGSNAGPDSNNWPKRRPLLFAVLQAENPDLFCAQEVLPDQLADLKKTLPEYGVVAVGRDGPGQGEHAPVFYRLKRFECVDHGTFWYNEDTTKPGKDWDKEYNRICTWVELKDKASGRVFRIWNSHFPLNTAGRPKAAALLAKKIGEHAAIPAIVCGDFNEPLGPDQLSALKDAGLSDSFVTAAKKSGVATFRWKNIGVTRIDWILITSPWQVADLHTVDKESDGIHPSDHNALSAQLLLP